MALSPTIDRADLHFGALGPKQVPVNKLLQVEVQKIRVGPSTPKSQAEQVESRINQRVEFLNKLKYEIKDPEAGNMEKLREEDGWVLEKLT